jgi:hypothetical protein
MKIFRRMAVAAFITSLLAVASQGATGAPPRITVALDASDAPRKILHAQLTIPASAGTLTLYYPKWIPGEHAPSGPVADLSGV